MARASEASRIVLEPGLAEALEGFTPLSGCPRCGDAERRRLAVNAVLFDVVDASRFLNTCQRFRDCGRSHVVHFLAVHPTVAARQTSSYRDLLNAADLVVPDGAPIAAVMRSRDRSARRLTSTDALLAACDFGLARGWRHYFVGGSSDAVASGVRGELQRRFPGLEISGYDVPPFRSYTDGEIGELASRIARSRADIVWIGIGAPRQELLAHKLRELSAAPVVACIGATFDFVAGAKRRAPAWMRATGLEWLFRLLQEPHRLWRRYLIGNALFIGALATDEFSRLRPTHSRGGTPRV